MEESSPRIVKVKIDKDFAGKGNLVFFQLNRLEGFKVAAPAWKVFSLESGAAEITFKVSPRLTISGRDEYGNHNPHQWAYPGKHYSIETSITGFEVISAEGDDPEQILFSHDLKGERYAPVLIRDSNPVAFGPVVKAGKRIALQYDLKFYLFVTEDKIAPGQVLSRKQLKSTQFEIDLAAISEINILVSGSVQAPVFTAD